MCGEQSGPKNSFASAWGSPPRVRGTAESATIKQAKQRITPACAGNSFCGIILETLLQDHPRVCGEQTIVDTFLPSTRGSPPRVRGTEFGGYGKGLWWGITPACAGNRGRALSVFP